jgi:hypothetical protein
VGGVEVLSKAEERCCISKKSLSVFIKGTILNNAYRQNVKKKSLFILLVSISCFCSAQKKVEINFSDSSTLILNEIVLTKNSDVRDIIANIGEPSKIVGNPNGERDFFYEEYGLLLITKDTLLTGLGINFNWDGDRKFPITSFTGRLKIGELSISKETKREEISSIKLIGFGCPIDILCASKSRKARVKCTLGFDSGSLSQIVFLLN